MKKFYTTSIISLFLFLTSCLSPRQIYEFNTSTTKIDDDRFHITSGHRFELDHHVIENYLLLAAAQATINSGRTHFKIDKSQTNVKEEIKVVDGYSTETCDKQGKNNQVKKCRTRYTPGYVNKTKKPVRTIHIKTFYKKDVPDTDEEVYEAIKIRTNIGSTHLRD